MRTEYRLFTLFAAALFGAAIVYWFWAKAALGTYDYAGTTALVLSGLLLLMCGSYFWFVSRRIEPRPEDRTDSEIADGAGEIGFFSPGSYWPFAIGAAASTGGLGLALDLWWLVVLGLIATIGTASAMIFEYYTGSRRSAER